MSYAEHQKARAKEIDTALAEARELVETATLSRRRSAAVLVSVLINAELYAGIDDYYIAEKLGLTPSFNSEIKKAKSMWSLMLDLGMEVVKK